MRIPKRAFPLVVIDQEQKLCRRYLGVQCTDEFSFETALTQAKVDGMRVAPNNTGTLVRAATPPEAA